MSTALVPYLNDGLHFATQWPAPKRPIYTVLLPYTKTVWYFVICSLLVSILSTWLAANAEGWILQETFKDWGSLTKAAWNNFAIVLAESLVDFLPLQRANALKNVWKAIKQIQVNIFVFVQTRLQNTFEFLAAVCSPPIKWVCRVPADHSDCAVQRPTHEQHPGSPGTWEKSRKQEKITFLLSMQDSELLFKIIPYGAVRELARAIDRGDDNVEQSVRQLMGRRENAKYEHVPITHVRRFCVKLYQWHRHSLLGIDGEGP